MHLVINVDRHGVFPTSSITPTTFLVLRGALSGRLSDAQLRFRFGVPCVAIVFQRVPRLIVSKSRQVAAVGAEIALLLLAAFFFVVCKYHVSSASIWSESTGCMETIDIALNKRPIGLGVRKKGLSNDRH